MPTAFSTLLRTLFAIIIIFFFTGCALFDSENAALNNFHTVIIDPGHGGYDHGAYAVSGKEEKFLTMDVAQRLKPLLQAHGYHVVMTRTNDTFIPLGSRTALSNTYSNAIFVSIHFNSSPSRAANGIETYYYNPSSTRLASSIFQELIPVYGAHRRGVKHAVYYVLHHNRRPATLLELGFISNRNENAKLQNPAVREQLAEHIARGIVKCKGAHSG